MRFFYVAFNRGKQYGVRCRHFPSREPFQITLAGWHSPIDHQRWTYKEIPSSCVMKLYGSIDWRDGEERFWPEDRKLNQ